jgi:hypothetical protein
MFMRRVSTWLLLFSLAFGSALSPAMAKEKASIRDLTLVIDKGGVGISFFVQHCFSPKIEETIQSGVPVTVFFSVRLSQTRRLWRDRRLAFLRFARRIHYDNLKKVYEVFLEDTSPAVVFEDFSEARESLASVDNVRLIPRRPLTEQATYYVSVKAELEPVRLPFRLESVLFFVPSGRRETDWFVQRFRIGTFVLPKKEETQ